MGKWSPGKRDLNDPWNWQVGSSAPHSSHINLVVIHVTLGRRDRVLAHGAPFIIKESPVVKNQPASVRDVGFIPGLEWSPGVELATHSSILSWKIPQTEDPVYSPWDHKESDMTERACLCVKDYLEGILEVLPLNKLALHRSLWSTFSYLFQYTHYQMPPLRGSSAPTLPQLTQLPWLPVNFLSLTFRTLTACFPSQLHLPSVSSSLHFPAFQPCWTAHLP